MEEKFKLVILGMVQNSNGRLLISQRFEPELPEVHLRWDLPGGTLEFGETPEETVKREILEETGLKVEIINLIPKTISKIWEYENHKQHTLVMCFNCKLIGGEMHLNDHKINDLKWITAKDIEKFSFLPTTKELIKFFHEQSK